MVHYEYETEPRLMLHAALFEAPGARHGAATGRIGRPRPKASKPRLPGRSVHAELEAAERAAEAKARPLTMDSFKRFAAQAGEVERQRAAGTRKEQLLRQGAVDFKWYLNPQGEAEYRTYTDPYGIAWEER
ncbi:hypothetical protein BST27_29235 [Mycobacterium intermedium]|uniref:Uncharacterized protein n=1 Tax=Mycobacterium intermedium TaxID=28445 RepID=A0A1E3S323_MYCIE|nr:hypothetical protein [Mycobacterium intermedium]MCV6966083.1 hypothetical protein [Mycobacterium intermedium]ODQ96510.1 hypothetical protein BHQ20_28860 [Mycobacterium intermedium]OPE48842.1 hypothetical protein BV508_16320 [Mycobacterium intermedium]ORA91823.1 hypothetical protein BST27_29235 [Mycobacterium intermedium]